MFYSLYFFNKNGEVVTAISDYYVNEKSMKFFAEAYIASHDNLVNYVYKKGESIKIDD